jgi:hypothetical protein
MTAPDLLQEAGVGGGGLHRRGAEGGVTRNGPVPSGGTIPGDAVSGSARFGRAREAGLQSLPHLQVVPHDGEQFLHVERLGEVGVRPSPQPGHPVLRRRPGRQEDHREEVRLRVLLQGAAEGVAVHAGHHDVGDHEIGEVPPGQFQRLPPVRRLHHAEAALQVGPDVAAEVRVVFGHQDGGDVLGLRRPVMGGVGRNRSLLPSPGASAVDRPEEQPPGEWPRRPPFPPRGTCGASTPHAPPPPPAPAGGGPDPGRSVTVKQLPAPGSLSTSTVPPWSCTSSRTRARPIPVPGWACSDDPSPR